MECVKFPRYVTTTSGEIKVENDSAFTRIRWIITTSGRMRVYYEEDSGSCLDYEDIW